MEVLRKSLEECMDESRGKRKVEKSRRLKEGRRRWRRVSEGVAGQGEGVAVGGEDNGATQGQWSLSLCWG